MAAPQNDKAGAISGWVPQPGEEEAGAAHPSAWMALKGAQGDSRDPGLLGNHAQLKHKGLLFLPLQTPPMSSSPSQIKIRAGKVPQTFLGCGVSAQMEQGELQTGEPITP